MSTFFSQIPIELDQNINNLKTALEKKTSGLNEERITDYLSNWLLDDEQKQILALNPWNIYFLYVAAHLCWIGAQETATEQIVKTFNPNPEEIELSSAGQIKLRLHEFGIYDEGHDRIIDLICSNLRNNLNAHNLKKHPETVIYKNASINIALLSCAINLAIELNLEHESTLQTITGYLNPEKQFSMDRLRNGFKVLSAGPHGFLPGTILLKIFCRDAEIHRALKHHERRIQRLLNTINGQVSPRFLFTDIIYEIEPEGYLPLDMKFSVDSMAALKLFTGNQLYSDKRVFLRELVQNAVDACNLRLLFEDHYNPAITIDFDEQMGFVRFKDNGIGMDRQWIEKYFLKIGISFYQSGDIKSIQQNRVDFNFISKFGIGFLSSFLVSDKIVIKTRKKDSPGLLITITDLQDYFDVRLAPQDCPQGTEVTLYFNKIKNSYSRGMEYLCYLRTNIRYMTIPVNLLDHKGNSATLGQEKLAYDKEDRTDYIFLIAPLNFQDSEAYLFLKAKRDIDTVYALDSAKGGISIFQDGIFVTQTEALLPEGARQNVIGRINLGGKDRCELSMDRNRIFWTEQQLLNIKRKIRLGLVDLANQLLTQTQTMSPPLTVETRLINHLAIFFDFNEIDDEMYYRLDQSVRELIAKRFRDFIRINFAHTGPKNNVPEADDYEEAWQKKVLKAFAKKSRPLSGIRLKYFLPDQ